MLMAEDYAMRGKLVLSAGDKYGELGFYPDTEGTPPATLVPKPLPCVAVGTRLASWPVMSKLGTIISLLPNTPPADVNQATAARDVYTTVQAFYLSLRGSTQVGAEDTVNPLSMLTRMASLGQAHEGSDRPTLTERVRMFEAKAKVWDEHLNPCSTKTSNNWLAKELRNKNYTCVPVNGNPNLRNYQASNNGNDYKEFINKLHQQISVQHEILFEQTPFKSPLLKSVWDLTH